MITKLFGVAALLLAGQAPTLAATPLPNADPLRIEARIKALSRFGANSDGGIDRVAYSDADRAARAWAMAEMTALGLQNVRIDAGGNILGRRPGTSRDAKPIMFGSHIDSVPGGGNYDGQAGVVAAMEVIALLNASKIKTRSPLDVVIFADEEGGLVGSLTLSGELGSKALDVMSNAGVSTRDGIRSIGGNPDALARAKIPKGTLKAFLELHIEQGGVLDEGGIDIGVVEGIVGIEWWDVTLTGVANHAGTTPMNKRTDALLAAANLTLAVSDVARTTSGRQVATVGRIKAFPGAYNVIPGKVEMGLEIRDLSSEKIATVFADIKARAVTMAESSGVGIDFKRVDFDARPALTDPNIRQTIAASAKALGLSYMAMPSGAGHDTQDMAKIAPTGMIFVPSVGGISHSPKEFTKAADLANGTNVLLRSLLAIDAQ